MSERLPDGLIVVTNAEYEEYLALKKAAEPDREPPRCGAPLRLGGHCKRITYAISGICHLHRDGRSE